MPSDGRIESLLRDHGRQGCRRTQDKKEAGGLAPRGLSGSATNPCFHTSRCVDSPGGGDDMATNLALDDSLIEEAVKAGNHRTKKEAVTAALREYVQARKRREILDLVGQIDYYDD